MKQLLLSTVILFGTLGSINAADAGEFKPAAPEDTELAEMGGVLRSGGAVVSVKRDYFAQLRPVFDKLDEPEHLDWDALEEIRRLTLGGRASGMRALERRQARLEEAIIKCLDEMTHYRPFVCADVLTPQNIVFVLTFLTINGILIGAGNLYPAFPPMAGASMIMVANLLVLVSVLYVKEYGLPERITCGTGCRRKAVLDVKEVWKDRLTNPALKRYVAELLSYVFIHKDVDDYEGSIRVRLERLFRESGTFNKLRETLLSEAPVSGDV
jgi:hypothetical protein